MSLFLWSSWSNGNEIKDLHEDIEFKNSIIDSLENEIDTLNFELELWDFNMTNNTTHLRKATLTLINGSCQTKEGYCVKCQIYMSSKPKEGMPNLIRTEDSLTKK